MNSSYLWRFPVLMIRLAVRRFGWKVVIIGWVASLGLIPVLTHYGF